MHSNIIKSVATPSIHIILSLIYYKLLERNKHDVLYVVHDYRVSMYMHDSKLVSFPFNHKQMVRLERYSSKRLGRRARRVSKTYFFLICLCITDEQGFFDWFLFIIISINGHHGYTRRSWQLTTRNDSFVLFHENIGSDRWWWIPQLYLFVGCNTQQRRDGEWCCLTSNMGAKGAYMYTYYSIIGNQLAKVDVTGVSHWLVATLVNWHSLFLCCCCSPFVSIVVLRYSRQTGTSRRGFLVVCFIPDRWKE